MFQGKRFPRGRFHFLKYEFGDWACNRRCAAGKAHTFENLPRVGRWMDCCKNYKPAIAIGAFQNVEFENPCHQDGPCVVSTAALVRIALLFTTANVRSRFVFDQRRNNSRSPLCSWRE